MRTLCASFVIATAMLSACDPPATPTAETTSRNEALTSAPPLPRGVVSTVIRLKEIAKAGGYRDLARLAAETPEFQSNGAGLSHRAYWNLKERTGDFPAEQVGRVLDQPYAVARSEEGRIYVWPSYAMLRPGEITPAAAREIDRLLGEGQAAELRHGAVWPGYVLGIREDGQWLYFVSGSG